MTDKTLPERMREAAETLIQAQVRFSGPAREGDPGVVWSVSDLQYFAARWGREDGEKAVRQAEINDLARLIFEGVSGNWAKIADIDKTGWRNRAQVILDAGYRKVDN